jgi:hypothetical protein
MAEAIQETAGQPPELQGVPGRPCKPFMRLPGESWKAFFWRRVNQNGPVPAHRPELGPCWVWKGSIGSNGYANIIAGPDGTRRRPHVISYLALVGPIAPGLDIDHLCRNTACLNPRHLEAVTHRVNMLRGVNACAVHARKTHCKHGHALTPENVYVRLDNGGRQCRTCNHIRESRRAKWRRRTSRG